MLKNNVSCKIYCIASKRISGIWVTGGLYSGIDLMRFWPMCFEYDADEGKDHQRPQDTDNTKMKENRNCSRSLWYLCVGLASCLFIFNSL